MSTKGQIVKLKRELAAVRAKERRLTQRSRDLLEKFDIFTRSRRELRECQEEIYFQLGALAWKQRRKQHSKKFGFAKKALTFS